MDGDGYDNELDDDCDDVCQDFRGYIDIKKIVALVEMKLECPHIWEVRQK